MSGDTTPFLGYTRAQAIDLLVGEIPDHNGLRRAYYAGRSDEHLRELLLDHLDHKSDAFYETACHSAL